MTRMGPAVLFVAWAIHDVEEALTFPGTCEILAQRTGCRELRMSPRQSWLAVGLMGGLVGAICLRARRHYRSRSYRALVAGLEAHVASHVAASMLLRGYTAGLVTALLIMWPGARCARVELARNGHPLDAQDARRGLAPLGPAALVAQVGARVLVRI